jgi:hypothetical protein
MGSYDGITRPQGNNRPLVDDVIFRTGAGRWKSTSARVSDHQPVGDVFSFIAIIPTAGHRNATARQAIFVKYGGGAFPTPSLAPIDLRQCPRR